MKLIGLPEATMNKVIQTLESRPFREVANLMVEIRNEIKTVDVVEPEAPPAQDLIPPVKKD